MKKYSIIMGAAAVVMLSFANNITFAEEWKANTPDSIQVVNGQKEYTMKRGDTLWAIGQKVNIKAEKLAEINGIDLKKGQQYKLPRGRVLSFGENIITVKDADGSIYSQSIIQDKDKINTEKNMGETADQQSSNNEYPYAVAREGLQYPAVFQFRGSNVPDSITLDFSQGTNGKVIFKRNATTTEEYSASFNTIATKDIRVANIDSTADNRLRTVKVNTEIYIQPSSDYQNPAVNNETNRFYLFINKNGGISLATPNYAGNYPQGEEDVMLEAVNIPTDQLNSSADSLAGYSDEQIEYARVTEALLQYYNIAGQPIEVAAQRNNSGYQVLPFDGSKILNEPSVTLSFSMDGTMASTIIVTYLSNHDGTIRFYKNPNHYQDERYITDPAWVQEESQKMIDSIQTLSIPTDYDTQAANLIPIIKIS